ncbi:uncharacterized protein VTP21DRAFT_3052 [Calcarisporiella thermophila]|uniref:uncharacterized protein n=1 Tax=Calcarisporiella thermophila TaxID=911321 RepID=UPI003742C965
MDNRRQDGNRTNDLHPSFPYRHSFSEAGASSSGTHMHQVESPRESRTLSSRGVPMTLGRCMCCSSQLRYPKSVSCYRCTVCDTINDLIPIRMENSEPLDLNRLRALSASISQKSKEKDSPCEKSSQKSFAEYEALKRIIMNTFSSWTNLNESFSNSQSVAIDNCGVDLDHVREAYKIIIDSPTSIVQTMLSATDTLLRRPGKIMKYKEDLKFLMIILENPLLSQYYYTPESQYHHGILKRLIGIISCLSNELHHYFVNWFARTSTSILRRRVELVNSFITYRLDKIQRDSTRSNPGSYESDWSIRSAARVMALLFAANSQSSKLPLYEFYNTMVDYIDLIADYDLWRICSGKFSFCQYPFLISMGAKMQIMDIDAKRQMENKFKEAIFTIIFQKRAIVPYLVLQVRRDRLIEDSLNQLASHDADDLKKSLRIEFTGEEGVDAGGLRKEWFLLLVKELFEPQYGMFTWDEDSKLCWFNPASFETDEQYYLVGVVIGLAIYNSTILDIHLPLACYKKLLNYPVGLQDLKEFRPAFARGLEHLLEFEGDVESIFCRDFVGEYEAFGEVQRIPLIPNGENIPVTNENRKEYVDNYVEFILNRSISRQFNSFKQGFQRICGGNALSLFRPEEIELLVRGSAEPLEIEQLRAVTEYEGFLPEEPLIRDFWDIFANMDPQLQRKLLIFVTGTDRIPATGTANLAFKISCIGEDTERLPISHTCFNQLCLYRYRGRAKLRDKLILAINESQGFSLR